MVPVGTNDTLAALSPLVGDLQPYYFSHHSARYLEHVVDALVVGERLRQDDVLGVGLAHQEADGLHHGRVVVQVG